MLGSELVSVCNRIPAEFFYFFRNSTFFLTPFKVYFVRSETCLREYFILKRFRIKISEKKRDKLTSADPDSDHGSRTTNVNFLETGFPTI
jgi:hypothetical protein